MLLKRILMYQWPALFFASFLQICLCSLSLGAVECVSTEIFRDDFEDGIPDGWNLQGWKIEKQADDGFVLTGMQNNCGGPQIPELLDDIILDAKFRLIPAPEASPSLAVFFRHSTSEGKNFNYSVRIRGDGEISLQKSMADQITALLKTRVFALSDDWHRLRLTAVGQRLVLSLDQFEVFDFRDNHDPILYGKPGFCSYGHVHLDDLIVENVVKGSRQANPWVFLGGPRGGIGYDIAFDPSNPATIWVTDSTAGAHRTLDGGSHWKPQNTGIRAKVDAGTPVFCLTIDKSNPKVIWSGLQGIKGVYRSTDGGETWQARSNGIPDLPTIEFRSFTIDPRNSSIVYTGGNYTPPESSPRTRGFIFKTEDDGQSWTRILDCGALVRWIIVDPRDSNIIYAATGIFDRKPVEREGILKSCDGGKTWSRINNGLSSWHVCGLVMMPGEPDTLFATTGASWEFVDVPQDNDGFIFKTTDGGLSWSGVDNQSEQSPSPLTAIAISPSDPRIIYVASATFMLKSTDGGKNWTRQRSSPPDELAGTPVSLTVHPQNPEILYVDAYAGGVFMSRDGGNTWGTASTGYSGSTILDLAVSPADKNRVYATQQLGTFRSRDAGRSWEGTASMDSREAWNRGVDLGSHQAVAINPLNPEEILAGSSFRGGMLIKSTDEGNSWRCALSSYNLVPALEERISVYRIRYSPSNPAIVYAVTGISENVISDFSRFRKGLGVFRSEDGGDSWRPVNHGLEDTTLNMFDLAVHPHNPDIVYVATLNEGIYASSDGGASWRSCSNGLKSLEVRSLAIDHTDPDTLYAGLGEGAGMFKSTDAGALWKEINKGVELMCHPWLFPVGGATASLSLNPVSAPDLLGSYTSMPWTSIRSIVIDPTNTNRVYAADAGTGVYLSTDFGETWSALNQGLQIRAVERLAISNDGSLLYAATRGAGVYRLTVDEHDQGSQRRPPRPRRLDR